MTESKLTKTVLCLFVGAFLCTFNDAHAVLNCVDSDGGNKVGTYGVVSRGVYTYKDNCYGIKKADGTFPYINEKSCSSTGSLIQRPQACPSGTSCSGGACVKSTSTSLSACKDSDGGIKPTVAGSVTINGRTYQDSCYRTTHVYERYCTSSTSWYTTLKTCPTGTACSNGACIKSTASSTQPSTAAAYYRASPTWKSFGTQKAGTQSSAQSFTFSNTVSNSTAILQSVAITSHASHWKVLGNGCGTGKKVGPHSCKVSVAFKPGSAGYFNTYLKMTYTQSSTGRTLYRTVKLYGTGSNVAPTPTPTPAPVQLSAYYRANPRWKSFGTQKAGTTSGRVTFNIENAVAGSIATVKSVAFSANATHWKLISNNCGTGRKVGPHKCSVTVAFNPKTVGYFNTRLRLIYVQESTGRTLYGNVNLYGTGN